MDVLNITPASHEKGTRRRRRERPGARTRHALTAYRKEGFGLQDEVAEGLELARGSTRLPPFDIAKPSPLRRQTFDQSWQRWKAREAEEKMQADFEAKLAHDQRRLFGGDVDDDELRSLGVLYDDEADGTLCEPPVEHESLNFRYRTRRSKRRPAAQLPLFLSFSFLSEDADIMSLMEPTTPKNHKLLPPSPQSLPLAAKDPTARTITSPILFPLAGDDEDLASSTWEIISNISIPSTPCSEPETWIYLGDDS